MNKRTIEWQFGFQVTAHDVKQLPQKSLEIEARKRPGAITSTYMNSYEQYTSGQIFTRKHINYRQLRITRTEPLC